MSKEPSNLSTDSLYLRSIVLVQSYFGRLKFFVRVMVWMSKEEEIKRIIYLLEELCIIPKTLFQEKPEVSDTEISASD